MSQRIQSGTIMVSTHKLVNLLGGGLREAVDTKVGRV